MQQSRRLKGGARAPAPGPPPLLLRLYGSGNVVCLRELLMRLSGLSREATALPAALVQPHDHADYALVLLEQTWCALRPGAPPLRDGFSLSQASNQHQLVGRAVEALLRSGQNKSGEGGGNVLCFGYRRRRPTAGGRSVPGMATAEASHHNSTTASLCSPVWQLLLSRIGDTLMLYLLLHTSMFAQLPNNCCLQLSGAPISQVARAWKKEAPVAVAAAATRLLAQAAEAGQMVAASAAAGTGAEQQMLTQLPEASTGELLRAESEEVEDMEESQLEAGSAPANAAAGLGPAGQTAAVAAEEGAAAEAAGAAVSRPGVQLAPAQQEQRGQHQEAAQQGGCKAGRPSSWQRRRAAKLREQQEAEQAERAGQAQQAERQAGQVQVQAPMQVDPTAGTAAADWELPSTEEIETDGAGGSGCGGGVAALAAAVAASAPAVPDGGAMPVGCGAAAPAPASGATAAAGGEVGVAGAQARPPASSRLRSSWPARMPRPTDMLLQRTPIFYCASFPQKPGLTTQHMLSKLTGTAQPERALFAAIFDPQHSPVGRAGASFGAVHSTAPPPARRVPARQRHLLPLLRQLIERAAKCPFSILLQHHCPLPTQLHQEQLRRRREAQAAAAAALVAGGVVAAGAAAPGAAARAAGVAAGTVAGAAGTGAGAAAVAAVRGLPLPSQGALHERVLQEQQRQEAALLGAAECAAAAAAAGAVPRSLDDWMDELFRLEQPPQQPQKQQQEQQEQQQGEKRVLEHGQQAQQQQHGQLGQESGHQQQQQQVNLMDELFCLEQQQRQPWLQQVSLQAGSKRARQEPTAALAAAPAAGASAASAGESGCSLASTQPAAAPGGQLGTANGAPAAPAAAAAPTSSPSSLASCFVPHRRVVAFVWAVLRAIVPAALLGDTRNRRVLRDAIGRFVRLRRYEQMSVHQVMQGLRVTGFPWLQPPAPTAEQQQQEQQQRRPDRLCASQHSMQQRQLALWLGWLVSVLVVPLLRAHFYCTESEAYRQQVFYYRKPVWAALARQATEELRERQFSALPNQEAQAILQFRKLGIARVRLLPKRTGMRVILNLGRGSVVRFPGAAQTTGPEFKRQRRGPAIKLTFRPVNSLLQNVYQVLRFEASCQPHLLGSSVFGYNDAFCKLQPFVRKWRAAADAAAAAGGSLHPLIVSVDVTRAFDNVNIGLLLSLAEPLLRHEQYLVLKYSEVVPSLGQVKVLHRRLAAPASPGSEAPPFPQLAQCWAAAHKGKAFTDQVIYERLSRQQALTLLRQHLTANIVRLRRRWCAQSRGIAQGSTLSTLLCSLYLAHLERTQLSAILSRPLPQPSAPAAGPHALGGRAGTTGAAAAGQDTVICLLGGNSAALSPAAVFSAGDREGAAGASSGGGSRGLLTELARAADSWATERAQLSATKGTGGAEAGPAAAAAAAASLRTSQRTPKAATTERDQQQHQQQRPRLSSGGRGGSGDRRPCGDLILLPASMAPAAGAAATAGAASVGGGGLASPAAAQTSLRRLLWPAAAPVPPSPLSPQSGSGQVATSQQQQAQTEMQQLGCSRLALHAGTLLLRLVDDFMLITAVPAVAQGFASRMLQGFEGHNVFVNPEKTKLSFALKLEASPAAAAAPAVDVAGAAAATALQGAAGLGAAAGQARGGPFSTAEVVPATVWRSADGCTFIKWCGLLVNTANLQLQGDYTRYVGEHLSTSLTLPLRKQPGAQLATRLCHYLRPKIHPLLLDATLNSPQTVRLNIYQAFLLGAMKFHCYVRSLPAAPAPGTSVLLEAILSGIAFMASLTRRRRVASAHQQGLQASCATRVPAAHIRWLGLTAFVQVLRRKQTRYAALLAQLDELARAPLLRCAACQLAPVVDPARSSVFDLILY